MTTVFFDKVLALIPFSLLILIALIPTPKYQIRRIPNILVFVIIIIMSTLLGLSPAEEGTDKYNYLLEFIGYHELRMTEIGWILYNYGIKALAGSNYLFFFLISAFFYTSSYYFFGKKLFSSDYNGYFIIMAFGMLGFAGCGNNTIRTGIALAVIFYSFCLSKRKYFQFALIILAILIHKSMALPVLAYLTAKSVRSPRPFEMIWLIFLAFSLIGFNLEYYFDKYSYLDERIEKYGNRMGDDDIFGGFRYDFLLYSVIPLILANVWRIKAKIKDVFYLNIYKTYLLVNSIWLLVIRMPQCNRIAYLSWFLIPILTIYPILTNMVRIKNAQKLLAFIILIFMSVNIVITFRGS